MKNIICETVEGYKAAMLKTWEPNDFICCSGIVWQYIIEQYKKNNRNVPLD